MRGWDGGEGMGGGGQSSVEKIPRTVRAATRPALITCRASRGAFYADGQIKIDGGLKAPQNNQRLISRDC